MATGCDVQFAVSLCRAQPRIRDDVPPAMAGGAGGVHCFPNGALNLQGSSLHESSHGSTTTTRQHHHHLGQCAWKYVGSMLLT